VQVWAVSNLEAAAAGIDPRAARPPTRALTAARFEAGVFLLRKHRDWAVIELAATRPEPAPARRIPVDWLEGVARLDGGKPPSDVPRHRWRQFVDDCKEFLSPSEKWAERAARLVWDAMALFGCAPKRPLDYLGSAGLLWAINGGRLLELHRDWAVIDVPVHGSQRIFYRRNIDAAKITLPWAKQISSRQPAALGRQGSRKAGGPQSP
jgi:hypothetical protein